MNNLSRIIKKIFSSFPLWLWVSAFLYIAIFLLATYIKFSYDLYNSFDLAISNQVFWNTNNGDLFASSIQPPTYLSNHLALVNFIFYPLYKIFPSAFTLVVISTAMLALSAFPLYKISKKYLNETWSKVIIGTWFLNPFVHSINLYEWHNTSIIPFFILLLWYFFIEKKFRAFLFTVILTVLIREEAAYAVASIGLLIIISKKINTKALLYGLTAFSIGIVWFYIALELINTFQPDDRYIYLHYYGWLGNSWGEIIKNTIFHPIHTLTGVFKKQSFEMFLGLLLPFSFIPLIRPKYLIGLIIPIGVLLLGQVAKLNVLFLHYSAVFIAAIFIAYIYSASYIKNKYTHINQLIILIISAGALYSFILMSPLPKTLSAPFSNDPYITNHIYRKEIVRDIPNDTGVIVTKDFATNLSQRKEIARLWYLFNNTYQFSNRIFEISQNTTHIMFSPNDLMVFHGLAIHRPETKQKFPGLRLGKLIEQEYALKKAIGPYLLFEKNDEKNNVYQQEVTAQSTRTQKLSESLSLHGWTIEKLDERIGDKLKLTLTLEKTNDSNKFINFKIDSDNYSVILPPSLGLYATPSWKKGSVIKTSFIIDPAKSINITPVTFTGERVVNRYASQQYNIHEVQPHGKTISLDYLHY